MIIYTIILTKNYLKRSNENFTIKPKIINKYANIFIKLKEYRIKNSIKKEEIFNFDYLTSTKSH